MDKHEVPVTNSGMELGLELVFSAAAGAGGGFLLDQWLGFTPWCMVAGLIGGAIAGFLKVIKTSGQPDRGAKVVNVTDTEDDT